MDVIFAVQHYINSMVESIPGMKILLLDKATVGIVSLAMTQAQINQKEVYLFDRLDNTKREFLPHLKAMCFLRPDPVNFELLDKELRKPSYGEYHLFFSNVLNSTALERLADADEHEVVKQIQEKFADYYPLHSDFFTLHIDTYVTLDSELRSRSIERTTEGLIAILQSMRKVPSIRYAKNSDLCFRLGQEVSKFIEREPVLFDFHIPKDDSHHAVTEPPLLLLLDRRNDPLTPLLTPWTYEALTHELIGLYNNRVTVPDSSALASGPEPVLSPENDAFYKANMFKPLGELGIILKNLAENYISKTKGTRAVNSITDMQRFVADYPDFHSKLSKEITMHVSVMAELTQLIEDNKKLEMSALEQELACGDDHEYAVMKIAEMFDRRDVPIEQVLKMIMLYTLRFEQMQGNALEDFLRDLFRIGVEEERVELIAALKAYAGAEARIGNLYDNREYGVAPPCETIKGMKHVPMRHTPMLYNILTGIMSGSLRDADYPFIVGELSREKPQDIIVFIAGGATYHEALIVDALNNDPDFNARVILGGSCVHNSKTFLDELNNVRNAKKASYRRGK